MRIHGKGKGKGKGKGWVSIQGLVSLSNSFWGKTLRDPLIIL